MYICICNGVTDRDIRRAVSEGANSLDALRDELGVASCCGTCACAAEALMLIESGDGGAADPVHHAHAPGLAGAGATG